MANLNSEIEWFQVTDALPVPGKQVLVSDGKNVNASSVQSIETFSRLEGTAPTFRVYWEGGINVIQWAFMPKSPEGEPAQDGPSIW